MISKGRNLKKKLYKEGITMKLNIREHTSKFSKPDKLMEENESNDTDVILEMSKLQGQLRSTLDLITSGNALSELNITAMELDDLYRDGKITRTHINGFNKELENLIKDIFRVNRTLLKLTDYSRTHTDPDTYTKLKNSSDWFRKNR